MFKFKYYSQLSRKWKKNTRTYRTAKDIDKAKRRLRKYVSSNVKIRINTVAERVKARPLIAGNGFYQDNSLSDRGDAYVQKI